MKTLTEFSTLVLKKAAAARAAVRARLGDAPATAPTAEAAAPVEGEPAPEAPVEAVEAAPAEGGEPKVDPFATAVAAELGVELDRALRLLEALEIIGGDVDRVRNVRVFQGETGPHHAISRGEFHYAIDRIGGGGGVRRGGGGGGGGGERGGGFGGPGGGDRKPRGLGSLKNTTDVKPVAEDDRPARGEMPRAGIGWQLTAQPREERGGAGRGGPRRDGRGPGGPRGDRNDRPRGPRPPRLGPDGQPLPFEQRGNGDRGGPRGPRGPGGGGGDRGPRGPRPAPIVEHRGEHHQSVDAPRLGPDGQPLPRAPRRERKPIGPDANGMGPDGKPWDPARRAQRLAEREAGTSAAPMNAPTSTNVETSEPSSTTSES